MKIRIKKVTALLTFLYAAFFRSAAVRRNVLRKKFWNQVLNKVPK